MHAWHCDAVAGQIHRFHHIASLRCRGQHGAADRVSGIHQLDRAALRPLFVRIRRQSGQSQIAVNAAMDIAAVKNHNIPCRRGFLSEGHGRNACQHQAECQNCRKNFFLPLHICLPLILF